MAELTDREGASRQPADAAPICRVVKSSEGKGTSCALVG